MTEYTKTSITAIVLAGGQSSRMGRDKALLNWRDRTLLSHICSVATECAAQVYIVTPWIEKYQHIVPQNCQLIAEKLLVSHQKSNSPIIGFLQALPWVTTEWVLLLACDLPLLRSFHVKFWYKYLETVLPTQIALLPRNSQGWEPLCGFYRRSCLPLLENYVARGGQSFQNFLAQYAIAELPVSDRSCLFNCNTPEDWKRITNGQ
ncbi:MAG: molybdenum cofactor guanylyltransferase [Pleurocapsa sp.]